MKRLFLSMSGGREGDHLGEAVGDDVILARRIARVLSTQRLGNKKLAEASRHALRIPSSRSGRAALRAAV